LVQSGWGGANNRMVKEVKHKGVMVKQGVNRRMEGRGRDVISSGGLGRGGVGKKKKLFCVGKSNKKTGENKSEKIKGGGVRGTINPTNVKKEH